MPPEPIRQSTVTMSPMSPWSPWSPWSLMSPVSPSWPRWPVVRTRLHDRLSGWAPVTVICGPSGSGKTTVVTSWLDAQASADVIAVWVSATSEAGDLAGFNRLLGAAMETAAINQPQRADTASSGALGRLHEALFVTRQDRPVVLVIDDVDWLDDRGVLSALIGLVQRHGHFHIIACARQRHLIESLAARSVEVNTIAADELLLDAGELAELARINGAKTTWPGQPPIGDVVQFPSTRVRTRTSASR
jgi:ATP/maltotriose-dependent transcriptional regulator MalT